MLFFLDHQQNAPTSGHATVAVIFGLDFYFGLFWLDFYYLFCYLSVESAIIYI